MHLEEQTSTTWLMGQGSLLWSSSREKDWPFLQFLLGRVSWVSSYSVFVSGGGILSSEDKFHHRSSLVVLNLTCVQAVQPSFQLPNKALELVGQGHSKIMKLNRERLFGKLLLPLRMDFLALDCKLRFIETSRDQHMVGEGFEHAIFN